MEYMEYLRLNNLESRPKELPSILCESHIYFCEKCQRYHWVYSDTGDEHKDYKQGGKQ